MSSLQSTLDFPIQRSRRSKTKNDENQPVRTLRCRSARVKPYDTGAHIEKLQRTPQKKAVLIEHTDNVCTSQFNNVENKDFQQEKPCTPAKNVCRNIFNSPIKSPSKSLKRLQSPLKSPRKSILPLSSSPRKTPKKTTDIEAYRRLKHNLTTGSVSTFVGRESERQVLKEFFKNHLLTSIPGSIYVSGAPGTGKTASITALVEDMKIKNLKTVYLNCMSHKNTKEIFAQIATQFGIKGNRTEAQILLYIEKCITSNNPVLLVLDEIDQLDSKNQSVLYTIFEWPSLANSKLVLVGIANMLDLTDRILPRLNGNAACKPELLNFPPYTKDEISQIINTRIQDSNLGDVEIIKPSAISFLAGKIAAVAGDVRKALDVCRRAVELVEAEVRKQTRLSVGSPKKTLKTVDIVIMHRLFNELYGARITNEAANNPNSIPLQQKILLCTLLLVLKYARSKDITIAKLHEIYCKICSKQKLPAIGQSEFHSLCVLLESRSILEVRKAKEPRNSKVLLRLSLEESEKTLGDKNLMATILEDKESLGNLCIKKN